MKEYEPERTPELDDHERQALWDFVDAPVPADFADRVATQARSPGREHTARAQSTGRRTRRRVWAVGLVAAAAAAALLLLFVRAQWIERSDRDELQAMQARIAADAHAPTELVRLRAEIRDTFALHCTPCHQSGAAGAKDEALQVFDVKDEQFYITMSDGQLEFARERMAGIEGMNTGDRDFVDAYVEAELAFREERT